MPAENFEASTAMRVLDAAFAHRVGVEQARELVGVAVVDRAHAHEHHARLLEAHALGRRLLSQRVDQLLVLGLERRELFDLVAHEREPAVDHRAALGERGARLRADGGRVVEAALVHHAARERLLEPVEAALEHPVLVVLDLGHEPLLGREREDARGIDAQRLGRRLHLPVDLREHLRLGLEAVAQPVDLVEHHVAALLDAVDGLDVLAPELAVGARDAGIAPSMNTIAAASGMRCTVSSGSAPMVLCPGVSRIVSPLSSSGCG
jgi:hypothetical protein